MQMRVCVTLSVSAGEGRMALLCRQYSSDCLGWTMGGKRMKKKRTNKRCHFINNANKQCSNLKGGGEDSWGIAGIRYQKLPGNSFVCVFDN